jgi:hypothetical protein
LKSFLAIYHGETIGSARLVAVSSDPELLAFVAARLGVESITTAAKADPVITAIEEGRQKALKLIQDDNEG